MLLESKDAGPGPGAYTADHLITDIKAQPQQQHKKPMRRPHFRVIMKQPHEKPLTPGPGQYDVTHTMSEPRLRTKSSPPMWVRVKTAPAIPNTNYGYKQTPEGNLEPDIPVRSPMVFSL